MAWKTQRMFQKTQRAYDEKFENLNNSTAQNTQHNRVSDTHTHTHRKGFFILIF